MAHEQPGPGSETKPRSGSISLRPEADGAQRAGPWSGSAEDHTEVANAPPRSDAHAPPAAPQPASPQPAAAQPATLPPETGAREDQPDAPRPDSPGWRLHGLMRTAGSFLFSMVLHLGVLIALGLWMIPLKEAGELPLLNVRNEMERDELETVVLDERLDPAKSISFFDLGSGSADAPAPEVSGPVLDAQVVEQDEARHKVSIGSLAELAPPSRQLLTELPDDAPGHARRVVDGYGDAMDRITREIMWMLSKQKVLVIWCFDQSESMKDDQEEIRARIERVYAELGLLESAQGDALATAVTSYGEHFLVHTKVPTSDLDEIRAAIHSVPIDPSGEEIMCSAVGLSINQFRSYARRTRRRMALILVTDETGDREDNVKNLETTIAVAQDARCKVYILGREAVFGYPYAFMRWRHPQTNRPHWLRIDRGPETAFVEQLQINGFRRRHDAFPAGYGPYEQSRLAKKTGGIFFLLPSIETNLVRGEKRRYELEAMNLYEPDLRARLEILHDRDVSKFRVAIWAVIMDLNPYNKEAARSIELRVHFSPTAQQFAAQARQEFQKAPVLLRYLHMASEEIEKLEPMRLDESDKRWRANFDLLRAQLVAYQVRIYEYQSYLRQFVAKPEFAPIAKPPNLRLTHWDITTRKETLTDDETAEMKKRAEELFDVVISDHPGTPWAARAQWEKRRGYGVKLVPQYEPPYKEVSNPIPVPKL